MVQTALDYTKPHEEDSSQQMFSTRKNDVIRRRIISAAVTVLVSVVIVTGVLGGIWLFTDHQQMTLQYALKLRDIGYPESTETVFTDVAENVVQYHVTSNRTDYWILHDFNKGLKVTKVVEGGVSRCLLSVLDTQHSTHPEDIRAPEDLGVYKNGYKARDSMVEVTSVSQDPITDRSFLGKAASKLCRNTPVYWEHTISPTKSDDNVVGRNKRSSNLQCGLCGCDYTVCIKCGSLSQTYYVEAGELRCKYSYNFRGCPTQNIMENLFLSECHHRDVTVE